MIRVEFVGGVSSVLNSEQSDETTMRGRDRHGAKVVMDHVVRQLVDGYMRAERAGPAPRDLFNRFVDPLRELVGSKQSEYDPFFVDHDTSVPTGVRYPSPYVSDPFV